MPRKGMSAGLLMLLFALLLLYSGPAHADDVLDSINQAIRNYQKGEYSEAVSNLDYAAQLIRQKRSEWLQSLLPEPLPGWKAKEVKSQAVSQLMFGGMISSERQYSKGASSVKVTIVTDSPMLQAVLMMFSNPMFAGMDGGNLQKIKGRKAIVTYRQEDRSGDLKMVVANRVLLTVEGKGISREDLVDYASAVDFGKLESL